MNNNDYEWYMSIALEQAEKAFAMGEVPVGACLVGSDGNILEKTFNMKECENDPTGHAEILALKNGGKTNKNWRLNG